MDAPKHIKVVTSDDASKLVDLRIRCYAGAVGFVINPAIMKWTYNDARNYNLGCYIGERLVSVLRVEVAYSVFEVEQKLQVKWTFDPLKFPVMILSKAATCDTVKTSGYNAVLRHWALHIAKKWGVSHVLGTFVEGSPRHASMGEMGYKFYSNSAGWKGDFETDERITVANLVTATHLEQALEVTKRIAGTTFNEYRFTPVLESLTIPPRLQLAPKQPPRRVASRTVPRTKKEPIAAGKKKAPLRRA